MKRRNLLALALAALVAGCGEHQGTPTESTPDFASKSNGATIGINVVLKGPATAAQLGQLAAYGKVLDQIVALNAVHMSGKASDLAAIQALAFVSDAAPDAERGGRPVAPVAVSDFAATGLNTWDLDAVNVTSAPLTTARAVTQDGSGVYVAILDTGLLPTWRQFFPAERIASQFATSFGGGGNDRGSVSDQPNKWEQDVDAHGTHVTSSVLGYQLFGNRINGVAPKATVIPVKVLNQNGRGWSSVIAHGIMYVADLKTTLNAPVVINLSLGGPNVDPIENAAIDYAISKGVIVVAAAGNSGDQGMDFPAAYEPVISVAAAGWVGQWSCTPMPNPSWFVLCDVAEPTAASDFYIADFSGRSINANQDLDVVAPGSWVVGPYQINNAQPNNSRGKSQGQYFFVSGTSEASPHVTGIVALMLQKHPGLTAAEAEAILEESATPIPPGTRTIFEPLGTGLTPVVQTWGANATGAGLATADLALAATP